MFILIPMCKYSISSSEINALYAVSIRYMYIKYKYYIPFHVELFHSSFLKK